MPPLRQLLNILDISATICRLEELFALDYELLLYDVTSTYLEGEAAANPLAQRGYSRDHRPDCKQVNIALVVTREGMPLGYELLAGNRADVTTVKEIVERMERRYGPASRIWVMDRAMASAANIKWLQDSGRRYLSATTRAVLRQFVAELEPGRELRIRCGVPNPPRPPCLLASAWSSPSAFTPYLQT